VPQAERAALSTPASPPGLAAVSASTPSAGAVEATRSSLAGPASSAGAAQQTQLALLVLALLALSAAPVAAIPWLRLGLILVGASLFSAAAILSLLALRRKNRLRQEREMLASFVEYDGVPCYFTDALGEIVHANRAARRGSDRMLTLAGALNGLFANPGALVFRLQSAARADGVAREEIVTRRGHLRLSARALGDETFLWRVEDLGDRVGLGRSPDALSLPMLTAGPAGTILFMNEAFRRLLGGRPRHLDQVFLDTPVRAGHVHAIAAAAGTARYLVAQINGSGGRKEIYLLPAEAAADPRSPTADWAAIEDLPVPLLKLTRDGEVVAATREARALLPMPIGPGTRLSHLLEGLGRPIAEWIADVAEGRPTTGPQFLRGTGDHQDTFLRVALSVAGPTQSPHLVAVLSDMTEFKSLEAQFVQSQKMQALGQLAGGVAHDFNNLLTAISGHCDLLLLRRDERDPDFGDLMQIRQNVNRAASLVSQLLAFSRKQNLMLESLDLREVLADLTHLLNRLTGERVRLIFEHEPELRVIRADRRQLEQVLMNLVVNARDAMPEGGMIRIETGNARLDRPEHRDRAVIPPGDYVLVQVIDEGSGIPPERLPKIFEPFYTTKRPGEGTGLGLSTAYGIVKQTGGFIFADSEVGVGTTFTLWFPAHDRSDPAPAPLPSSSEPDRRGEGVILIAEDEAPVRAFASRALRLKGYTVIEADSAEAALDLLSDATFRVDLFITDVIMPGKNGPTWVREALAARPGTRVIFVSGYAEETFAEQKTQVPDSVFLPKPFSLTQLTEAVQAQLG
jgi:two-component system cell cycle sensor histidine kinase/response regulator CckA